MAVIDKVVLSWPCYHFGVCNLREIYRNKSYKCSVIRFHRWDNLQKKSMWFSDSCLFAGSH